MTKKWSDVKKELFHQTLDEIKESSGYTRGDESLIEEIVKEIKKSSGSTGWEKKVLKHRRNKRRRSYINWKEIKNGYNERYGTSYSTVGEMLKDLYYVYRSSQTISELLGCSKTALLYTLRRYRIPISQRGGNRSQSKQKATMEKFQSLDVSNMTIEDIERKTGFSKSYCYLIIKRLKLKHPKMNKMGRKEI